MLFSEQIDARFFLPLPNTHYAKRIQCLCARNRIAHCMLIFGFFFSFCYIASVQNVCATQWNRVGITVQIELMQICGSKNRSSASIVPLKRVSFQAIDSVCRSQRAEKCWRSSVAKRKRNQTESMWTLIVFCVGAQFFSSNNFDSVVSWSWSVWHTSNWKSLFRFECNRILLFEQCFIRFCKLKKCAFKKLIYC